MAHWLNTSLGLSTSLAARAELTELNENVSSARGRGARTGIYLQPRKASIVAVSGLKLVPDPQILKVVNEVLVMLQFLCMFDCVMF